MIGRYDGDLAADRLDGGVADREAGMPLLHDEDLLVGRGVQTWPLVEHMASGKPLSLVVREGVCGGISSL